jgi:hypothetical protein
MYGYVPGSSPGGRLKRERPCAANDLQLYVVRQIPDALPQSERGLLAVAAVRSSLSAAQRAGMGSPGTDRRTY